MGNDNGIFTPPPEPVAVISITLMPGGQVVVSAGGGINQFTINGMLGAAKDLLLAKIAQAASRPLVEASPPGLRF